MHRRPRKAPALGGFQRTARLRISDLEVLDVVGFVEDDSTPVDLEECADRARPSGLNVSALTRRLSMLLTWPGMNTGAVGVLCW